ncbi:hypothetical protein K8I28_14500 [bacterium]|nr:hypothetical protein [bacterium]
MEQTEILELRKIEATFESQVTNAGIKSAFLHNLDEKGILFRPTPVEGRRFYEKQIPSIASLRWAPTVAVMSVGEDFGFTTGPWEFQANPEADLFYGQYVSIWQNKEGVWKLLFDAGNSHQKPEPQKSLQAAYIADVENRSLSLDIKSTMPPIEESQKSFRLGTDSFPKLNDISSSDLESLYDTWLAKDCRLLVDGDYPITDRKAALSWLTTHIDGLNYRLFKDVSAPAGDLGYGYGVIERGEKASEMSTVYSYLHIWQQQDRGWKIVLVLLVETNPG